MTIFRGLCGSCIHKHTHLYVHCIYCILLMVEERVLTTREHELVARAVYSTMRICSILTGGSLEEIACQIYHELYGLLNSQPVVAQISSGFPLLCDSMLVAPRPSDRPHEIEALSSTNATASKIAVVLRLLKFWVRTVPPYRSCLRNNREKLCTISVRVCTTTLSVT